MGWNIREIAGELGTKKKIIAEFLATIDYPNPEQEGRYSDRQFTQIQDLFESTGAARQLTEEGQLRPNWSDHMNSQEWDLVRRETHKQSEYRCRVCGARNRPLAAHHNHYDYLGQGLKKEIKSTISICENCHPIADLLRKSRTNNNEFNKNDLIRFLQQKNLD